MPSSGFHIGGLIGAVIFAVAGTFMFRDIHKEVMRWEIPCTFTESRIVEKGNPAEGDGLYTLEVAYTYTSGGRPYTGRVVRDHYHGSRDRAETEDLARRYAEGSRGICYVSWFDSSDATLEKPIPFLWIFVVFPFLPLVIVILGFAGAALWRRLQGKGTGTAESPITGPLTQKKKERESAGCLIVFFGIFFGLGSVLFFVFFIRPVFRIATSGDWVEVPCTIISSEVGSHSDSDGTTYSIDITYKYEYDGTTYEGDAYGFMGGSSSGYEGKAKVVRQYPRGSEHTCFVDPENPSAAVLSRDLSWEYLLGFIPLVFVIVGALGIMYAVGQRREQKAELAARTRTVEARPGSLLGRETTRRIVVPPKAEWLPKKAKKFQGERGPIQLKPSASPRAKAIAALFFALFWNGILSIFLLEVIEQWASGRPDWRETLFLVPFVLVGLGLIGAVVYFLLATRNPRPIVSVSSRLVPLGGAFEVAWLFEGDVHRLESLRIYLEGREEARYRRGTDTCTDKNTFAEIEIVSTSDMAEIARGEMAVAVPDTTMHSFEASNNKTIWTLKVHGGIRRWPDVKTDYEIVILPLEPTETVEA